MFADRSVLCPVLVGRTSYLDSLTRWLKQVRGDPAQILLLSGEAGIGKSRLVAEAKKLAGQGGFRILQGNCYESDRILPFAPVLATALIRPLFRPTLTYVAVQR